jgi:hypothetical protein
MRFAQVGEIQHAADDAAVEGLALVGFTESHTPSTPPMLSICRMSPGFTLSGTWPE